jgi:hypothetical protein
MTGALGFLSPWMLIALGILPLLWLLLRLTPPRPQRLDFPPTRLLIGLEERQKTPARTPWWLTLLRLLLAALIILALAEPVLRPDARLTAGSGPLLIVLDNGWASAADFDTRRAVAEAAIAEVGRDGRPMTLVATADKPADALPAGAAADAAATLGAIDARPYPANYGAIAERLAGLFDDQSVEVLWLAGSLDHGGATDLATVLERIGASGRLVLSDRPLTVLRPPENAADRVRIPVSRLGDIASTVTIAGFDAEGRRIVETAIDMPAGGDAIAEIALPAELRNELTRFALTDEASAAAVQLLDGRWRRKTVGLVVGEAANTAQPLLEPLTYVDRALAGRADILRPATASTSDALAGLIDRRASMIVLTETGNLPPETGERLRAWINAGGTLVRFASSRLAASDETLLPVPLREGERALGGSLSWAEPQTIGDFAETGPFAAIEIPRDVRINRQILADPNGLIGAEIWAELTDGTPLVTARRTGKGRIVLFHVTADPRWSNLPISGAFVQMLTTIADSAQIITADIVAEAGANASALPASSENTAQIAAPWKPLSLLNGYGRLTTPPPGAVLVADISQAQPSIETPPGLYDRTGTVRALNTISAATPLTPLTASALGWSGTVQSLEPRQSTPLWPLVLALAAAFAVFDALAVLFLSGRLLPSRLPARTTATAAILVIAAAVIAPQPAKAQDPADDAFLDAALKTRLAYVLTGDDLIDETSRAGLVGLTTYLTERTALEPGEPAAVDLASDELVFYAFLYWPVTADADVPPADVMAKVDTFMKSGGTILFDTRDAGGAITPGLFATSEETEHLREILAFVDVPPLEPVPPDHVLTKAFYLLSEFPGRWRGSDLWVESLSEAPQAGGRPARGGDGVSPIIITGNDMAAAWAISADGRYLYPTVPSDQHQRELAYRSGVNIVMYTLTGNYKADQVHIPALLERLGQ